MGYSFRAVLSLLAALVLTIPATLPGFAAAQQTAPGPVTLTAQMTPYGFVLFTGSGQALYALSFDTVGTMSTTAASTCTGKCATAWIPFLAGPGGSITTSGGLPPTGVGTIPRTDANGLTVYQVTYYGHPLYTFVRDTKPGQTNGENVAAFLGIWQLLFPGGQVDPGVATVSVEKTADGTVLSTPTAFSTYRTLYMLTFDPANAATCVGPCAQIWPPLLTTGAPVAGTGVNASLLGTTSRPDGTTQVTYNGHPLYLYMGDLAPGAASGLTGGEEYVDPLSRGVWYTVTPAGAPQPTAVTLAASTAGSGSVLALQPPAASVPGLYTLYTFSTDTATTSTCTGLCARFWPPLLASGTPTAGSGVDGTKLGTMTRADGTTQVTYNGHPLYLFVRDSAGTIVGNAAKVFGGTFNVVTLSGTPTIPFTGPAVATPHVVAMDDEISASFTVTWTSVGNGQGYVYFGTGAGCTNLLGVATQDLGAGTNQHSVTVTGNELAETIDAMPVLPGGTYSFKVATLTSTGTLETNDNGGKCYTVSIPNAVTP